MPSESPSLDGKSRLATQGGLQNNGVDIALNHPTECREVSSQTGTFASTKRPSNAIKRTRSTRHSMSLEVHSCCKILRVYLEQVT
eukprot:2930110-Amphidinium_carterae.1